MSPGFDSVSMIDELAPAHEWGGGSLEQTYVYLDHKSALDWIQLCNTPSYVSRFRESFPFRTASRKIREVLGPVGLDLIALGPGDGNARCGSLSISSKSMINQTSASTYWTSVSHS